MDKIPNLNNFLQKNKIANYEIKKIAGDASFRSYYRIFFDDKTLVLMLAPPDLERIEPFIKIDKLLIENNFFAPKIFDIDYKNGFILLEDFGDETYNRALKTTNNPTSLELNLYKKACDCLIKLHKIKPPTDIDLYNNDILFREAMLFVDWYLPFAKKNISLDEKRQFKKLWFKLFDILDKNSRVLVLRDFHADNLMILKNNGVGLLDFQDALIGSKAYDLASLLEDVRRNVNEKNKEKIIKYYLEKTGCNEPDFMLDYDILSLQRGIKIIGIFCRLSIRDNKNHYLTMIPNIINNIKYKLTINSVFTEIQQLLLKFI
jgi:aminoglycoside/choline kinase family phosphotransferase